MITAIVKTYRFLGKLFFESTSIAFLAVFINLLTSLVFSRSQDGGDSVKCDANISIILVSSIVIFISSLHINKILIGYTTEDNLSTYIQGKTRFEIFWFFINIFSIIIFGITIYTLII